jgi:hypothetical protein
MQLEGSEPVKKFGRNDDLKDEGGVLPAARPAVEGQDRAD